MKSRHLSKSFGASLAALAAMGAVIQTPAALADTPAQPPASAQSPQSATSAQPPQKVRARTREYVAGGCLLQIGSY